MTPAEAACELESVGASSVFVDAIPPEGLVPEFLRFPERLPEGSPLRLLSLLHVLADAVREAHPSELPAWFPLSAYIPDD